MSNIDDPVYEMLVAARVQLLFDMPFFGTLATRLRLQDASEWCNTVATDGRYFYYNRDFIKSLTKEQLMFVFGHDVLHIVYDHLGRRGGRDPALLGMAQDYIINYTLKQEKCGEMPPNGLIDNRFTDEMLSEEVYDILEKETVTIKMTLDEHLDFEGQGDDEDGDGEGQTVEVRVTGSNGKPKLSQEDLDKIRAEIKAAVVQAAQQVGAGNVPKGVARMIHDLIEPKLDWRALLDAHIRSSQKDDYTFQRLSRRTSAMRYAASLPVNEDDAPRVSLGTPILPTQDYMDTIDIFVAIDASGSMTEAMLRDQLSEVKGIMETFREFKLTICTFDTQVYDVKTYTGENLHDIDTYPMKGGGGTMFECVWEYMKKEGIEPNRLVLFTDGLPNATWGDPNYVDTLFVIHTYTNIKPPWGMHAYYEPKM